MKKSKPEELRIIIHKPTLIVIGGADRNGMESLAQAIHKKFAQSMNNLMASFSAESWALSFVESDKLDDKPIIERAGKSMDQNGTAILTGYRHDSNWENIMTRLNRSHDPVSTLLLLEDGAFGKKRASRNFDHWQDISPDWPVDVQLTKAMDAIRESRHKTSVKPEIPLPPHQF